MNPNPTEQALYYQPLTDSDVTAMLKTLGLRHLDDLYAHLDPAIKKDSVEISSLQYAELLPHLTAISQKNKIVPSFIGDGLTTAPLHPIVDYVSSLRRLVTAYTPYQPERSQGTLISLWAYTSLLAQITGFEAINASLYDRATAIFEAAQSARRITKKNTCLLSLGLYPGDREVVQTLAAHTGMQLIDLPLNAQGVLDQDFLGQILAQNTDVAAIIFPQVNRLGPLENVHQLCDLAATHHILSIGVIDPLHLATDGLCPPAQWGKQGADLIVGEGQGLAAPAQNGGPGLGIFGVRYNAQEKLRIRSTPGRYIGRGKDRSGRDVLAMVLATREQHIRREKATSNICSNQSFMATLAGANLLGLGEEGFKKVCTTAHHLALEAVNELSKIEGIKLAYPGPIWDRFTLELPLPIAELQAASPDLLLGVDVSTGEKHRLLITISGGHTPADIQNLAAAIQKILAQKCPQASPNAPATALNLTIPPALLRADKLGLPNFAENELKTFYDRLNEQNVGTDDQVYPLGSCTMKYNPFINDQVANLPGFTQVHPQMPDAYRQGSLALLFEIQEMFKAITGLPGVVTCPMAGAQGELCGIKMIAAYHHDRHDDARQYILIPHSAHGTNPATAAMAGYRGLTLKANQDGQIDQQHLQTLLEQYGPQIAGIMITNPNTSGIWENEFAAIARQIHAVGGLVYMDGANMNAIAGRVNLQKLGVDASHQNLHKTWSIAHGGGGPGDAIVAVSEKLLPFMPGEQVIHQGGQYQLVRPAKSIGRLQRHYGNFAHKIRGYAYLKALGGPGIRRMSALAVLANRYIMHELKVDQDASKYFTILPAGTTQVPRMHEFILALKPELFEHIVQAGVASANVIAYTGKLFLDFGIHAPTVAFPEVYGLMIEPTESFSKAQLDQFIQILKNIGELLSEHPEVLLTAPHFTPVDKIDEVGMNKNLILQGPWNMLPTVFPNRIRPEELLKLPWKKLKEQILAAHQQATGPAPSA